MRRQIADLRLRPRPVQLAGDVYHLQARLQQTRQVVAKRQVDVARAAAAAKDQQGPPRRVQLEARQRLFPPGAETIPLQGIARNDCLARREEAQRRLGCNCYLAGEALQDFDC